MSAQFSWNGFDALQRKLARLKDPDAEPLMKQWQRIIVEDNRKGVLAGIDKDGNAAPPLKYRNGIARPVKGRKGARKGTASAPPNTGAGANLSSAEYRKLDGPRLAPRREQSRVIANLYTGRGRDVNNRFRWYAVGAWRDVVSKKGAKFLRYHFEGLGHNKKYDLRGVRPEGLRQAREELERWVDRLLSR